MHHTPPLNLPRKPTGRLARREAITFYLLISPWLLGLLIFVLGPITASLGFSFTRWDMLSPPEPVGLRNYARLLDDRLFWQSLSVTVRYTLMYVPSELIGGLLLALLMNQVSARGIRAVRTIYYMPSVLSGVAFVVVWMWLFHPEAGLINATLAMVGIRGPRWLADPNTALTALWLMSLWGLGRTAVIYLAGLRGIPRELYEAAEVEGANAVQKWWRITVPLLKPTTLYLMVIYTIAGFQVFERVYIMTGGGPINRTTTIVQLIYMTAFSDFNFGRASAQALVLFAIIAAFSFIQFRFLSTDVEY